MLKEGGVCIILLIALRTYFPFFPFKFFDKLSPCYQLERRTGSSFIVFYSLATPGVNSISPKFTEKIY